MNTGLNSISWTGGLEAVVPERKGICLNPYFLCSGSEREARASGGVDVGAKVGLPWSSRVHFLPINHPSPP